MSYFYIIQNNNKMSRTKEFYYEILQEVRRNESLSTGDEDYQYEEWKRRTDAEQAELEFPEPSAEETWYSSVVR